VDRSFENVASKIFRFFCIYFLFKAKFIDETKQITVVDSDCTVLIAKYMV
jgi:hypothetical protein